MSHLLYPFTKDELKRAVNSLPQRLAHGPDLISNHMIKLLSPSNLEFLLRIYNKYFSYSNFPDSWRDYFVVMLPKTGSSGFRPISLGNSICKIFEKMLHLRLEWWIENCFLLPPFQNGFRRGRSTIDSLTKIYSDIKIGFARRAHIEAVFLDISGAFDSVLPEILLTILEKCGFPRKISKFIHFITNSRHLSGYLQSVHLGNKNSSVGLPQGSSLSPILFNIYISFICLSGIHEEVKILCFADNIALYCSSQSVSHIYKFINQSLSSLSSFLSLLGLKLNPLKSQFIFFFAEHRIRNVHMIDKQRLAIKLGDSILPCLTSARFLGIIFSSDLSWRNHFNDLRKRATTRVNVLKVITGLSRGSHPSLLLLVYKQWIRPLLEYGSQIFIDAPSKHLLLLDRIQFASLRLVFGLLFSVSTNVLLDHFAEWPLFTRFKFLLIK